MNRRERYATAVTWHASVSSTREGGRRAELRAATSVRRVVVKHRCSAFGLPRQAGGCEGAECGTTVRAGGALLLVAARTLARESAARGKSEVIDDDEFDEKVSRTRSVVATDGLTFVQSAASRLELAAAEWRAGCRD